MDSGPTCHICNVKSLFEDFKSLQKPRDVTLGDKSMLKSPGYRGRHSEEAQGSGVITLKLKIPGDRTLVRRLNNVLYVPQLAYNLLSVSKMTEMGKKIRFNEIEGCIVNDEGDLLAIALKMGNFYYLN